MKEKHRITVYSSEVRSRSVFSHLIDILREIPLSHELGGRLFIRNLKALYRQSLLGLVWALLLPLSTAVLWIFLRSSNIVNMDNTGVSYPIFALTGTMLWQIFSESIVAPINQVVQNKSMLSKINIPREGLLLSGAYELAFNGAVKVVLLMFFYLYFRQTMSLSNMVFALVGILVISLAGFTIGLILTPIGMLYQDVTRGLAVTLPFFMYITPVVYPIPQEGLLRLLMNWNPMSIIISQTRNWFTAQPTSDLLLFWLYSIFFLLLFLICLVVYRLAMPMIIERMGS